MSETMEQEAPTRQIILPYTPRPWQLAMHQKLKRFNVLVVHRGAGKTVMALNQLIRQALSGPSRAEYVYLLPLKNQAHRNVWLPLKRFTDPIPYVKYNNNTLEVILPNEAKIMVLGADDPEKLRGLHLHGIILDEFADMHPNTWRAVRPMLSNHDGWVIWIGTPKGHNEFYRKYLQSQEEHRTQWFGEILPWWKTHALKESEIELMRSEMLPEEFAQELECFPPGSMVAMADDVRPIEYLKPGDLVWTHTGRLRPIRDVMSRHHEGSLVTIEAYGNRPLRLTPEHPVYTYQPSGQTHTWKQACDITNADWLVTPKKHIGLPLITPEFAELIGWFVAEGSVSQTIVQFSLGAHETDFIERVQGCLQAIGRDSEVATRDGAAIITCCDVALADQLVASCGSGAGNKRLPLPLIAGHERLVFDTLINGDGCIHRTDGQGRHRLAYKYTTISERLAQQVQLLGASLGLAGTYTARPGGEAEIEGRKVVTQTSYCVQLWQASNYDARDPNAKVRHGRHGVYGRVKTVVTKPYKGLVYNLSVAEDESYLVNTRAVHNCSFEAALVGSYYGNALAKLRDEGRISDAKLYRDDLETYTAWDLGIRDRMAVWFFQLRDRDINFIDYEEHSNWGFPEWAEVIRQKERNYGYRYGVHIAPSDIKNRELGSGISRLESAEELGIRFEICPKQDVMDGIELVRRHLPRCRFHSVMCADGLEALSMYRAKIDKAGQGLGPEHSIWSHSADALRYAITHVVQVLNMPALVRMPFLRSR